MTGFTSKLQNGCQVLNKPENLQMTDWLNIFTHMDMHQLNTPPRLVENISNGIAFALVVDDFGNKSISPTATAHLLQALCDKYKITTDPDGTKY